MRFEITVLDKVFQEFLARLKADSKISADVVKRLQQDVIDERNLKADSIKAALFADDELL